MIDFENERRFNAAMQMHVAGKIAEAQAIYLRLLPAMPQKAELRHLLGMSYYQLGKPVEALPYLQASVELQPKNAKFHGHLAMVLMRLDRLDEAIASFGRSLELDPNAADVLNNLGLALMRKKDNAAAIEVFSRAMAISPNELITAKNLGTLLNNAGRHAEAVAAARRAFELAPTDAQCRELLATALSNVSSDQEKQGNPCEALASLHEAIQLCPNFVPASFNYGKTLYNQRRIEEALAAYQKVISLDPSISDAHNNLGLCHLSQGRLDDAIVCFREAIRLNAKHSFAWNNLGNAFRRSFRYPEAEAAYRQSLSINPNFPESWNNLGALFDTVERHEEAKVALIRTIELMPDSTEARVNLGNVYKNLGLIDEAIESYQEAVRVCPTNQGAYSNWLYTMHFQQDATLDQIAAAHRQWNTLHAANLSPRAPMVRGPRDRLRVGYVAPCFRNHCQSFFTLPLLRHHNRENFEIFLYSDVAKEDGVTAMLKQFGDTWRRTIGMSDESVAELIRADKIDILVDLSLHMSENRVLVFARKPAPLQITWLGYPGTTGLMTIDYRITDPYLDPPGKTDDANYSEASYRLPDSFWCYDPLSVRPAVSDPPVLSSAQLTFGCLNNFCKINDKTLDLWAPILRALPSSHLLLLVPAAARTRLARGLEDRGIVSDRVEFCARMSREEYLETYRRIDIGLDTIPYNGHTTTLDALWMGVPVVTLIGASPVARAGWSQLNNLGLTDLAAETPEAYHSLVLELAGDLDRLRGLHRSLRDRLAASPLMDGARFARNMERAYQSMWNTD